MSILNIAVGAILLTLGRKFFWFFVAATGFYAGLDLATRFLHGQAGWISIVIAIAAGLVGALLAYFAQKLVIAATGFLAGAFIGSQLVSLFAAQLHGQSWDWIIILIAGLIGIGLMLGIFEWALMILSSFAGSILIVTGLHLIGLVAILVGLVLFVVGLVIQNDMRRRSGSQKQAAH